MLQLEMREKELIKYGSRPLSALMILVYQQKCTTVHVAATQNWQICCYSFTQHPFRDTLCTGRWPWWGLWLSGVATELVLGEHALDRHLLLHLVEWLREGVLISWRSLMWMSGSLNHYCKWFKVFLRMPRKLQGLSHTSSYLNKLVFYYCIVSLMKCVGEGKVSLWVHLWAEEKNEVRLIWS